MASICTDDWASLGVLSGHERKPLRRSGQGPISAYPRAMGIGILYALGAGLMWGLVFIGPLLLPDYPAAMQAWVGDSQNGGQNDGQAADANPPQA